MSKDIRSTNPYGHRVNRPLIDRPKVDREQFLEMSLRTYIEHYIRLIDRFDNPNQQPHQKIKDKELLEHLRECRRMAKKDLNSLL